MLQMNGATLRDEIEERLIVEPFQFRQVHALARPYGAGRQAANRNAER
jgi:hypothetical protein